MVSEVDRAKRALVTLLKRLAAIHVLTLDVSSENLPTGICALPTVSCLARFTPTAEADRKLT